MSKKEEIFDIFNGIYITVFTMSLLLYTTDAQYNSNSPPNYCTNQNVSCRFQGKVHFACNKTRTFWPNCAPGSEVIEMTQSRIDLLLDIHNSLRNQLALGNLTGLDGATLPPAIRMSTVRWNKELSDLAELNVRQCKMSHDPCHNTAEFRFSGQNLGILSNNVRFRDPDEVINGLSRTWFNQYKMANGSNIDKCCFTYSGYLIY